ncbi:MAG: polyphosphate kinase 2 family protein [Chloroflexaceae bacterium]|nr:polyphosphate kinase 2 family protein [Chloroflexaceae bacterium]
MTSLAIRVEPGKKFNLAKIETRYSGDLERDTAEAQLEELTNELSDLQEMLYAADTHSVLVVLQGMDTSGKDGTIRKVFSKIEILGARMSDFKTPSSLELSHDFLWRVHYRAPRRGDLVVFNRSHYEDVLIARVRNLVPESLWSKRYRHINDFERLLADHNTIILKFFLHIGKDEQKKRLLEREQDISKAWKLAPGDWYERPYWDDYMQAYEDALRECSTEYAPWYVIPADRKWFRNIAVAETLVATLRAYAPQWAQVLEKMSAERLMELEQITERKA